MLRVQLNYFFLHPQHFFRQIAEFSGRTGVNAGCCKLGEPDGFHSKTIANALKQGINEHYDSVSGKPLGVPDYCMSCTLVTLMLDGLTNRHHLKLRDERPGP